MRRFRTMCVQDVPELEHYKKELEQKNQYKDLDVLEDTVGIKKYIRGLIRKGKDRKEIISKTVEKFEVPKKRIRELYRECNGKSR